MVSGPSDFKKVDMETEVAMEVWGEGEVGVKTGVGESVEDERSRGIEGCGDVDLTLSVKEKGRCGEGLFFKCSSMVDSGAVS